jgi:hypothetical protein
VDHLQERSNGFGVERLGMRLVHKRCIEGADLGCIRPSGWTDAPLTAFKDFLNAGLGGNVQGGVNADRTAVGRDESAVKPSTIAMAEKIVTGVFREICAGKIESPASGGGARRLSGGADVLRDQNRDGKHRNAIDRARHCFHPSDRPPGAES